MIDANTVNNGLIGFYIVGAIVLLAIAIVSYPTLRERAKKKKKR